MRLVPMQLDLFDLEINGFCSFILYCVFVWCWNIIIASTKILLNFKVSLGCFSFSGIMQ
jgi:hypothetical protein